MASGQILAVLCSPSWLIDRCAAFTELSVTLGDGIQSSGGCE